MDLKERAAMLRRYIPAILLALKDRRTGIMARVLAFLTAAYALSPIDLIPDFIPVLGYLDDLIILPALIALTIRLIPKDILDEYLSRDVSMAGRWYYALPAIAAYAAAILIIVKAVIS